MFGAEVRLLLVKQRKIMARANGEKDLWRTMTTEYAFLGG